MGGKTLTQRGPTNRGQGMTTTSDTDPIAFGRLRATPAKLMALLDVEMRRTKR
jgi:hypothetical protein